MTSTPDRQAGVREEEGLILRDEALQPAEEGELRNDNGALYAKDAVGVYPLRRRAPTAPGQILSTFDGVTVAWVCPLSSRKDGWLVNNKAQLIVRGLEP